MKLDNRDECGEENDTTVFTKENFTDMFEKRKMECDEFYSKVVSRMYSYV